MKLFLCIFEQLSRLKINFHKSDFFALVRLKIEQKYKDIVGCGSGSLPFRYLGVPTHYRNCVLQNGIQLKLASPGILGAGRTCFSLIRDKLVLVNSVLTSLPILYPTKILVEA